MPTVLLIVLFFLALTPASAHNWKGMALVTCTLIAALVLDISSLRIDSFAMAVRSIMVLPWMATALCAALMVSAITRGIMQARRARTNPPGNTLTNRFAQAVDLTIWYLTLLFGLAVWIELLDREAGGELLVPFLLWLITILRWSCNSLLCKIRRVIERASWQLLGKDLAVTQWLSPIGCVLLSVLLVMGLNRQMPGDHYYVARFGNSQPPTYEVTYGIPGTGGGTGSCPVDPDEAAQYLPGTGAMVTTPFLFGTCSLLPMTLGEPGSLPAPLTTLARYRMVNIGHTHLFLPAITLLDTATRTRLVKPNGQAVPINQVLEDSTGKIDAGLFRFEFSSYRGIKPNHHDEPYIHVFRRFCLKLKRGFERNACIWRKYNKKSMFEPMTVYFADRKWLVNKKAFPERINDSLIDLQLAAKLARLPSLQSPEYACKHERPGAGTWCTFAFEVAPGMIALWADVPSNPIAKRTKHIRWLASRWQIRPSR